ncbi:MAG: porin family protein [Salinivirgaceae bacterium]
MKKLIILFLLIPLSLFAQKSKVWNKPLYDAFPFHFGFAFTFGVLDFSVEHSDYFLNQLEDSSTIFSIEGQAKPLFGASMVSNLRITDNFDLRFIPGLHFGQRDLTYLMVSDKTPYDTISHNMKIESTFLQFPLLLKYRAVRQNNYRPYLIGGVNYAIDLAARKKIKDEEQPKIRLNRQDLYLEVGFGVDYYLPFFKFSTELRFSYGLMNVVTYDDTRYTKVFDKLGSKMTTLVIYFE